MRRFAEPQAEAEAAQPQESGAVGASDGDLTEGERERVFAAYRTCSLRDEYSTTVALQEIEEICPELSRAKILEAINQLKEENKCGPLDENTNKIYKI